MKTTLLLLSAALLSPLAVQADTVPTLSSSERWEQRYHDRIGGKLLWNAQRDMVVVWQNIGADAYHYVYWVLKLCSNGEYTPCACFRTWSDAYSPQEVSFTRDGIRVLLRGGEGCKLTHVFHCGERSAALELWLSPTHRRPGGYDEVADFRKLLDLNRH